MALGRLSFLLLLLFAVPGCGAESPATGGAPSSARWPSAEARTLREGHAPTPFTAEQIREGCPSGRVATFRVVSEAQGDGLLVFHFADADAEGVTFSLERLDDKHKLLLEPAARRQTWKELQGHASFPADRTRIRDEVVEVPAGSYACLVYEVDASEGGETVTQRFDFARSLPGLPIRVLETRDGRVVSRQELLSNEVRTP